MPPEEPSSRPVNGYQPYARRRLTVDGISSRPSSRPDYLGQRAKPHSMEAIQPVSTQPHPQPQPETPPPPPPSVPVPSSPPTAADPVPPTQPETERFAPPKPAKAPRQLPNFVKSMKLKKPSLARRTIKIILIVLAVIAVSSGLYFMVRYNSHQNNPDTVFKDALKASLSTTKLQSEITTDTASGKVSYDLTTPTNPKVSSESTIKLDGSSYDIAGYGTAKNSYVSYISLPKTVSSSLSSVVKQAWVGIRVNGALPAGVPAAIAGAGDPRNLAYGPLALANMGPKPREKQVQYMIAHKVYGYELNKVVKTKIGDTKVLVYDVKPNVGYLKIANQSAALSAGLTATDIQDAVNGLDKLNGSTMKLYVSTADHQLVRTDITKNNQTTTTLYRYDSGQSLPEEPQTKLSWANFANYQFQIEAQTVAKQPPAKLDAARKTQLNSLHKYLALYFQQNGSYPSLANINDQAWVAGNLGGLDPDSLRDPLAVNLTLLPTPKAAVFAYLPLPAGGKGACDNTDANQCAHYKLIATLSNNQQYIVQDH